MTDRRPTTIRRRAFLSRLLTSASFVAMGPALMTARAHAQQGVAPRIRAAAAARTAQGTALAPPGPPFVNPPGIVGTNGSYALDIAMRRTTFAGNPVDVRAFVDPNNTSQIVPPLVGPTITLTGNGQPVQKVSVRLRNRLPLLPEDTHAGHGAAAASNFDAPHGFNTTNLHTHGLHIDPFQDNVFIELTPAIAALPICAPTRANPVAICAGQYTYDYAFGQTPGGGTTRLPAGTYWYHPHKHGSVGVQVASGMAGAFIVQGDLDGIQGVAGLAEQVMVAQLIPVATYATDPGTGVVNPYAYYGINPPGQSAPPTPLTPANKQISVNGQINPTVTVASGEIQRWRFVNATADQFFYLQVVTSAGATSPVPLLFAIAVDGVPLTNNPGQGIAVPYQLATPSLSPTTAAQAAMNEIAIVSPGQRLDLLVQAPAGLAAGTYSVQAVPYDTVNAFGPATTQNIVTIQVAGTKNPANTLPASSLFNPGALFRPPLGQFIPVNPTQNIQFGFTNAGNGAGALVNNTTSANPFGAGAPPPPLGASPFALPSPTAQLPLRLNAVDLWQVTSDPNYGFGPHAFHIHINSFIMMQRNGVDISGAAIWRDTARIDHATAAVPSPTVRFASYQTDYVGDFVTHCHVLEHEDSGMMWSVNIS